MGSYVTAEEAAKALGVSLPTLYAYVSRGLIRSEQENSASRRRRYLSEDVQGLKQRQEKRRNPDKLIENTLHWGAPVLESSIALIRRGNLYYRGHSVRRLARDMSVEQVAALIWTGDAKDADELFSTPRLPLLRLSRIAVELASLRPFEAMQVFLPLAAVDDVGAWDFRRSSVAATGARILRTLTKIAAKRGDGLDGVAESCLEPVGLAELLQQGWAPDQPDIVPLLSAALIVCADHELNASSFVARCAASAQSTPFAVVMAGLATLQGVKHGGHVERVEALLREITATGRIRETLGSWLRRGDPIPGLGHPLYPDGDPRFEILHEGLEQLRSRHPIVQQFRELVTEMIQLTGKHPTVDFALVMVSRALELPPGSALALFALGRMIGWIGHAQEQYELDRLIRPRATYVGRDPDELE